VTVVAATVKSTSVPYPRFRDRSARLPRVDPSQIASALGAEVIGTRAAGIGSPLSIFQVRQELHNRLRSTGGRPGLAETSRRVKIPLSAAQWKALEGIAEEVAEPGFTPSAGQIASVLLSLSLRSVREAAHEHQGKANQDVTPTLRG
jgi:hypothetical protein